MFLFDRPLNNRIRAVFVLIGAGLLCAGVLVQRQWQHEKDLLQRQLSQQHRVVAQWLGEAQWVLRQLREKASRASAEAPEAFGSDPDTTPRMLAHGLGFSWDHRQGKADIGNLLGSGPLEGRDTRFQEALARARHLAPMLANAAQQLPEGSRLRYESNVGLSLHFPWEPSSRGILPQPQADTPRLGGAMPRAAQWGDPFYTDPQIGLLVPLSVEVFADETSVGRLQIDLTLAALQRQVAPDETALGQIFLVDERGSVLTYPGADPLQSERAPRLGNWLATPWVASARELHALPPDSPRWFGDRWVLRMGFTDAPWSLVLEVRRGELLASALQAQAANLWGLFLFILLVAAAGLYGQRLPQLRLPLWLVGPSAMAGGRFPAGQAVLSPAPSAPGAHPPAGGERRAAPRRQASTAILPATRPEGRQAQEATAVQRAILPRRWPEVAGWEMAGAMRAASTGGKDFYDWMRHPDGSVAVVLVSVRGTGVAAALFAVRLRTAWRVACHAAPHDPVLAMRLWQGSLQETAGQQRFAARALHMVIDTRSGLVQCVSAAHAPPWHLPRQGLPTNLFQPEAWQPDLMAPEPSNWPLTQRTLMPGEVLVLVTDHSRDVTNYRGETLGANAMVDLLSLSREVKAEALAQSVLREVIRFADHPAGLDDIGCVVIRRQP